MVKHCRIDKTFQPQQRRVTLAVETPHLRYAVEKALEALQGGTSNGTGTKISRLVGGHEVRSEGSAREKVLEKSIFWAEKGVDPRSEKWKMMMASQAIQQQARMWHARRVSIVFFFRGSVTCGRQLYAVLQRFSAIESSTNSGDGTGVILDPCSPQEFFFGVGYTCTVKASLCKRVKTQTCDVGERSTQHVGGRWFLFRFC